ncbi:MAG: reverse transcriptase/maturase family protein [Prevotella sp.]|jgi:retron-type reverse transcriptase|nr:reverse transcriptase/maturase family protein [Prevotella sp.]
MKRHGNLYSQIISIENLILADKKARKGKLRSYGVLRHDANRQNNILSLHDNLTDGTFSTSPYKIFTIHDPKEREIYQLPYYPDRIVHHAIMNILEPIFVSVFTADTYSCIKGRGIHAAASKLKHVLHDYPQQTTYCLKLDIHKFYPSIDHSILKNIIRRKIKDKKLLTLLDEIIDSALGVPIGNYLSQYFANLYLAHFDHWLKEVKHVKYYFRYADDMVILHSDKDYLRSLFLEIQLYLNNNLNLQVKSNWQIFPVASRGIDFLGYVFYHTHTRLRKRIKQRFCRRIAQLSKRDISEKEYQQVVCSWMGWAKHCDSKYLLKKILK